MAEQALTFRSRLPVARQELFEWHTRPGAFTRLAPPWQSVRELSSSGGVEDGALREFQLRAGPFAVRWIARHEQYVTGRQFVDRQVTGPFAAWLHRHCFESVPEGSLLTDEITFRLPLDVISDRIALGQIRKSLFRTFRFRHQRTRMDLLNHAPWRGHSRRWVIVGPQDDFVADQLGAFLSTGGHAAMSQAGRAAMAPRPVLVWRLRDDSAQNLRKAVDFWRPDVAIVLAEWDSDEIRVRPIGTPATRSVTLVHGAIVAGAHGVLPRLTRRARFGLAPNVAGTRAWVQLDDLLAATLLAIHDVRVQGRWFVDGQQPIDSVAAGAALRAAISPGLPMMWGLPERSHHSIEHDAPTGVSGLSQLGYRPWFGRFEDAVRFELGRLEALPADVRTGA